MGLLKMANLIIWKLEKSNGNCDFFTSKAKALRSAKINLEIIHDVVDTTIKTKQIGKRMIHVNGFTADKEYHSVWIQAEQVF